MMTRKILAESKVHSMIADQVGGNLDYRRVVDEAIKTVEENDVVVIGMAQNPYPKKALKLLKKNNIPCQYLEYGSYMSEWKKRGALKMWSGWQTLPIIFVKGTLIGGYSDLKKLHEAGELKAMLEG